MEAERGSGSTQNVEALTELVGANLDEPSDGDSLARAANYSRFYFQRIFRRCTGETPGRCRRRLLLERAGYQLLHTDRPVTVIAFEAGFDSLEGFSRAFRRASGAVPSQYRGSRPLSWFLSAPNDIHYDPVVGAAVRLARQRTQGGKMDFVDRLIEHDLWLTQHLLERAKVLKDAQLDASLTDFDNPLLYRSSGKTMREMLDRLVFTKETWMASIHGRPMPDNLDKSIAGMLARLESAFGEFIALVRRVRDDGLWNTSFMDMLCEPPETFTYGGMIAHVLTFSAYRRTAAIEAMKQFGIADLGYGDPITWERSLTKGK
jgi:AraC-like DNA-binding protein